MRQAAITGQPAHPASDGLRNDHVPITVSVNSRPSTLSHQGPCCAAAMSEATAEGEQQHQWPVIAACLMTALLALVIIRWRRGFVWWEFAAMWALIGLGMTIGVAETREAKIYGADLSPLNLQQTAAVLGYLALPAATLAGASVAEVTVRATAAATQNAERFAKQGWPYLILVVVLCLRSVQCVWLIAHRDPVVEGLTSLLWACRLGGRVCSGRPGSTAAIQAPGICACGVGTGR